MVSRRAVAVVAVLGVVVASPVAVVASPALGTGATDDSDRPSETGDTQAANDTARLVVAHELALTPDTPGEVRTTVTLTVPSAVTALTLDVPANATVTASRGFTPADDAKRRFEWTGETPRPSLTLTVPANESVSDTRSVGPYYFVDAGSWAVVSTPRLSVDWAAGDAPTTVTREYTTAGPGVATESIAYLGPHTLHTRRAAGQRLALVEPRAASMAAEPAAVLDSLAAASRLLRVEDRDDQVVAIAAPTTVSWRFEGLTANFRTNGSRAIGDAFWVRDTAPVDDPQNVWVHEYVHTRQAFRPDGSARWVVEGSASYYALLVTLATGGIDFGQYRDLLTRAAADSPDDAVLANPDTWDGRAPYTKGMLVAGYLDRRIRLASGGERSLTDVFRRLNAHEGRVTGETVRAGVAATANDSVAGDADRYATTTAQPSVWDRETHAAAFDGRYAGVDVRLNRTRVPVSGPYRDVTLRGPSFALATGETTRFRVTVENLASTPRNYTVPLTVDGRVVRTWRGRLDGRERTTLSTTYTVSEPGTARVSTYGDSVSLTVRHADGPWVADLRVNRTALAPGEAVALTATVRNDGNETRTTTVVFSERFGAVAERSVTLAPGDVKTVTVTETLQTAGTYNYSVGSLGPVTVTVRSRAGDTPGDDGGSADESAATADARPESGSGLPLVAVFAVLAGVTVVVGTVLAGLRRRSGGA